MPKRQPVETRASIITAAFWEIYRHGFQSASIDRILAGTSVTRGALFHHFPTKQHLGHAVVDEAVQAWIAERWIAPLGSAGDGVAVIDQSVRQYLESSPDEVILGGCPLGNLAQEMSALDEGFRQRLDRVTSFWCAAVAEALRRDPAMAGRHTDIDRLARFVVSGIEGALTAAKLARRREAADELADVLRELVASGESGRG